MYRKSGLNLKKTIKIYVNKWCQDMAQWRVAKIDKEKEAKVG